MNELRTYADFGIDVPKGKTTGQAYATCPKCSADRRKKNVKCLGVNLDLNIWHCVHCDWKGSLNTKVYAKPPEWENKTNLRDEVVTWFQSRNIKSDTVVKMRVTEGREYMPQVNKEMPVICFNYYRDGKLVNIKYRDGAKNFKLFKDAELIFYNIDAIKDSEIAYIVEGEIDCLTMVQNGFAETVSVPNGANKKTNNLAYLDNCYTYFESKKLVYIITDNDEPGERLADELARRIGYEKCKRVNLGEYKDINEAYSKGARVKDIVEGAKAFPIEGVYTVDDRWQNVLDILKNGHKQGWKPRGELGKLIQFHPGYLTVATGIPGHGKSELIDQITQEISKDYDLKGGFFSPENAPIEIHMIKLIEKLLGKPAKNCQDLELRKAKEYLNERIFWVYPEDDFTLETLLEKFRQLVLRHGINWIVLDPWNKIEHKYAGNETQYISQTLDKIINFCKRNGVHCFLVAHPTKMKKDDSGLFEVPTLYDISGSANFYNKADAGLVMYKQLVAATGEYQNTVYVPKVKFKHWGEVGQVNVTWNKENGRFDSVGVDCTNWLIAKVEQVPLNMSRIGQQIQAEREKPKGVYLTIDTDKPIVAITEENNYIDDDEEMPF